MDDDRSLTETEVTPASLLLAFVGGGLHAVLGILIAATSLVAPVWAVATLVLMWLALLLIFLSVWRRRTWLAIVLPLFGYAAWIAAVIVGGEILGWRP